MKFLTGIGVTALRGSISGLTASANSSGPYFKSKPIPTNPNTARQQDVRNNFMALAAIWSTTLTFLQRSQWAVYADNIVFTDSLGQSYKISAFNHYMRSNLAILAAGLPRVDDGPTVLVLPESDPLFSATASEGSQLLSIVFDPLEQWVNEDEAGLIVQMSLPRSPGREFIGGPFRIAGTLLGDQTTPLTSPQTLAVPFPVAEDQKVEVTARIVLADGRVGSHFRNTSSVAV